MFLCGKKAIVTGGSRGIGFQIAHKLAELGANVTLVARNKTLLESQRERLSTSIPGQAHSIISCDLNYPENIPNAFTAAAINDTAILVNCAGVTQNLLLLGTSLEEINSLMNTNLVSPIVLSQLLLKPMMRNKFGHVISISSVLATKGVKGSSVYSSTKGGLVSFTKAMAVEMGPKNIRFNCILPGLISTDMGKTITDLGIYNTPLRHCAITEADIADAVVYLLSSEVITGQCITIDNGFTVS
ncbi:hypothetical protein BABINDRAFT_42155 [Babjeviella inositovora NRRL Y-12698]|uniref:3-oxoacyl-[acyl-carrier-protein] reductase n=1 Tax=Babjeviella inositovora NRRL Y-12698 TaxID=984486 RepID=A0A1E3QHZ1_9ASCO|nr:uncharacterized protein BABINDRAFT_42155 [Babjeviella inositovora NRRL Y-12698]ODQ77054.1 hypothetical protein BABINDRAFT_42155 [Babjeviella inositovora NRRL Y-12698]